MRARGLAERVGSPDASAMMELSFGVAAYFSGHFAEALALLERAHRAVAVRQEGITWEVHNCLMYRAWSQRWRGDLAILRRETESAVRSAQRLGNRLAEMALSNAHGNLAVLAFDGAARAREVAEGSMKGFSGDTFQSPQYMHLLAMAHIELASGEGARAWARVSDAWPKLRSLGFFRMQLFRTELSYLRACAAIGAAHARGGSKPALLREARGVARALLRDDFPIAQALGLILQIGLEDHADPARLRRAAEAASTAGLAMHEALLRLRLGEGSPWPETQGKPDTDLLARALLPATLWRRG